MYIFRWLMKHPVIILALYFLSIIAILYSMTGGDKSAVDAAKITETQKIESAEVDLSEAPTIEPSTLTSALVNENVSDEQDVSDKNIEAPETEIAATETSASKADESNIKDEVTAEETSVSDEAAKTNANADLETQFGEMSAEELLLMARESYWNNGLEESAQIYQQLIQLNPDVIDYKGELGNVYWRQGFPKKAAALYAEISQPMIDQGNADRVANMVGFIGLFFPEKATEIHNTLQAGK